MKDWYAAIYKGFIIAGYISFIIGFFSEGSVSLGAYLAGYSVLILGIMMILTVLLNNILRVTQTDSIFQILYAIFLTTGPFLLMLLVIGFILYLMIFYKDSIIERHVSKNYYSFSNISVILLLIQLYLVFINISTEKFQTTGKISKVTSSLLYLLGVLNAICSIVIYTILKYFKTDGFQSRIK